MALKQESIGSMGELLIRVILCCVQAQVQVQDRVRSQAHGQVQDISPQRLVERQVLHNSPAKNQPVTMENGRLAPEVLWHLELRIVQYVDVLS